MSFTGDLEHLSIVDVVQLLHATRKSGTLTVSGRKGSAQLVFSDGFIVSANHFDERLRIGTILVGTGLLKERELDQALAEQQSAGARRRPLIATLIESGRVKKSDAFRGLETLIELTIVDILTWQSGTFTLDVGAVSVADEYRYFPEKLREDLHFNTENVLMEALRIFDEKKRDGELPEPEAEPKPVPGEKRLEQPGDLVSELVAQDFEEEGVVSLAAEAELAISPDDLGLGDVDRLERRIPDVFTPIEDRPQVSPHCGALREAAPDLPEPQIATLAEFLDHLPPRPPAGSGLQLAVILLGADPVLAYCLGAVGRHGGFGVFATTDPEDVEPFAEHQRGKGRVPILLVDRDGLAAAGFAAARHRHLGAVELTGSAQAAGAADIRTTLALPSRRGAGAAFAASLTRFLESFPVALREHAQQQGSWVAAASRHGARRLLEAGDAAAVAQAVLTAIAALGARALLLVVRGGEVVSAAGHSLHRPGAEPASAPTVRIPLADAPQLRQAVDTGRCLIVPAADPAVSAALHPAIGAPADPTTLLVPLAATGRTVSLVHADFGAAPAAPPPLELLEAIAAQAGTALKLVLCTRKLEKFSP